MITKTYTKIKEKMHLYFTDISTRKQVAQYTKTFSQIKYFCLFIGYPRSGHSLFGSLLDAHPDIVIANELDALKYFDFGLSRDQIFHLILQNSIRYAIKGRIQTNYNYDVPGQWQGRFSSLHVIGDKKGGMTTERIGKDYGLLDIIPETVAMPVKFIHVVRNPYDNITTMTLRTNSTIHREIEHYFQLCSINQYITEAFDKDVITFRHEDIIDDPEKVLTDLTKFLDLSCPDDYIKDCSKIISKKPSKTRTKLDWTEPQKNIVKKRMADFHFLKGYNWNS